MDGTFSRDISKATGVTPARSAAGVTPVALLPIINLKNVQAGATAGLSIDNGQLTMDNCQKLEARNQRQEARQKRSEFFRTLFSISS